MVGSSLTLGRRLWIGFGVLVVAAVGVGAAILARAVELRRSSAEFVEQTLPAEESANSIRFHYLNAFIQIRTFGFTADPADLNRGLAHLAKLDDAIASLVQFGQSTGRTDTRERADRLTQIAGRYRKQIEDTRRAVEGMEAARTAAGAAGERFAVAATAVMADNYDDIATVAKGSGAASAMDAAAPRLRTIRAVEGLKASLASVRIGVLLALHTRDAAKARDAGVAAGKLAEAAEAASTGASDDAERTAFATLVSAAKTYSSEIAELVRQWEAVDRCLAARAETAKAFLAECDDAIKAANDETEADGRRMLGGLSAAAALTLWGVAGGGAAAVVLAWLIARSITRPLTRITSGLADASHQTASASEQISSAGQSLAQGASEQAASLEETGAALTEMSSMTRRNADAARQASGLADATLTSANRGGQAMARMSDAMTQIQSNAGETAKIIKVIDEIAFQTNLLALNAAVEAARAGEAGKGFAVVAEEVRNLAMRSAEAAKNTAGMIEQSVASSRNGVAVASEVGQMLGEIEQSARKVSELVSEITAASDEQAKGIEQVSQAVSQMDKVTQQNAANAEESAAASEELASQARHMHDVVRELSVMVGTRTTPPTDAAHPASPARSAGLPRDDRAAATSNPARPGKSGASPKDDWFGQRRAA
jgi:ABC-type transporter Mla subunit MlaD